MANEAEYPPISENNPNSISQKTTQELFISLPPQLGWPNVLLSYLRGSAIYCGVTSVTVVK